MTKIYRSEEKYVVDESTLQIIDSKLKPLMETDAFQKGDSYRIRSLYFDDYEDSAFFENDAGVEERKKIRIRVYDDPKSFIRLEIKNKLKGKNLKESCPISIEQFNSILNGTLRYDDNYPKALRVVYLEMMLRDLHPTVITEYERRTYVYNVGNIRVTFDRNISYSDDFSNFLEKEIALTPLLPIGKHVLEVKYDELLPEFLAQAIETGLLERSTFSKYYLSRLALKGEYEI